MENETTAIEVYRPQIVLTTADAAAQAAQIREMTRAVLVEGTDYGRIPGTGSRPVLLKPGAEWLLKWFGLNHHLDLIELERDEKNDKTGVTYRAVITKPTQTGMPVIVATCDGYAGRDESKWRKAPWNTILKMAQKRALVGATLQATGTSGLFTQDIEDEVVASAPVVAPAPPPGWHSASEAEEAHAAMRTRFRGLSEGAKDAVSAWMTEQGYGRRMTPEQLADVGARIDLELAAEAPFSIEVKDAERIGPSPNQLKAMGALCGEQGIGETARHELLETMFNVTSANLLTKEEMSQFLDYLSSLNRADDA